MRPLTMQFTFMFALFLGINAGAWGMHVPTAGNWYGRHYVDSNGNIVSCVVAARYENDHYLLFLFSQDYGLHMGIGNASWALTSDDVIPVAIEVDGVFLLSDDAFPVSETVISIHVPAAGGLEHDLSSGSLMTLELFETRVEFSLETVDAGLRLLQACADARPAATE